MRRIEGPRLAPAAVLIFAVAAFASTEPFEAVSLFGRTLASPSPDPAAFARYEEARRAFEASPTEEATIWLGRRLAYLGRYREAVAVFTGGIARFPESYRLYRHRGHRHLTLRRFGRAIADFEKAAALVAGRPLEIEPDGVPNRTGTPVSNTQFNIYYHLGLARYLVRDWEKAEAAYRECLRWSPNDDSVVAVSDWLYQTLRRAGKTAEADRALAPISAKMALIENGAYLERLLMFKGEIPEDAFGEARPGETGPETAIRDFGLGLIRLWRGDETGARERFETLAGSAAWASFAAIAAEVELAHLVRKSPDRSSVGTTLTAWTLAWNLLDLDLVASLFAGRDRATYFSSEKPGLIRGFPDLIGHHRGFGFVPGGTVSDNRLWLEDFVVREEGEMAFVAAGWLFSRDVLPDGPVQRGPVTFVLVRNGDGWRILHAHFANDPGTAF